MGTGNAEGAGRNYSLPGVWSLGLRLPVASLLLHALSYADKLPGGEPVRSRCRRIAHICFNTSFNAGSLAGAVCFSLEFLLDSQGNRPAAHSGLAQKLHLSTVTS